jgi:hypothetical protein
LNAKNPVAWIAAIFIGACLLVILLPLATSPFFPGAILTVLPMGWWHFLKHNLPQITVNWPLIATGVLCSALVLVLGHYLLRALSRQLQQLSHPTQAARQWCWRWTVCSYFGVWMVFIIAFGAAGVLRHTTWLLQYPGPWYERRINLYSEMRVVDGTLQMLLMENNSNLESTLKAFNNEQPYRASQTPLFEDFNVIFYSDRSNQVAAYVIIPRTPRFLAKGRFGVSTPATNDLFRPISELKKTMADLDAAYPTSGQ